MAEWELERSLGGFAAEMRGALLQAPDRLTAERHLGAMLAASEAAPTPSIATAPARRRPRFAALRIAAATGAGLVLLTGGLAIAGVRPPEPISDALEAVGIDVPGSDAESSEEPRSRPPDSRDGGSAGGGDAPAATAGGDHADQASGQPSRAEGKDRADPRRSDRGEEASAEGQETAAEASSGGAPPTSPGASDATPPQDPGAQADPATPAEPTAPPQSQGTDPPAQDAPAEAPGTAQSQAAQDAHGPD